MSKIKEIIGKRVGRLTVIKEDLDRPPKFRKKSKKYPYGGKLPHFYCKCDCGNVVSVRKNLLTNGKKQTKSCGCLQREKAKETNHQRKFPTGIKPLNDFILSYKQRAKKGNYSFLLTKEEFSQLIKQSCHYCGNSPTKLKRADWEIRNDFLIANGIDRINSNGGYTADNVVPCCGNCNYAKSDLSQSEFLQLVGKIYERHKKEISRLTSIKTVI
jgi:hypothetical protein